MASQVRRILWNTRERATSTDFNDATNLHHRALSELMASYAGRQGGVIHGLVVSATGVGMNCSISPGLATIDNGGATADDSDFDWIELEATGTVLLSPADPTNPRWDIVEIAPFDVVELSSLRDVFNPALGTFTPQTLEKRRGSSPILSVRSGTPSASPTFPTGAAGVVPLAYIYVPAAAASLTTGNEVLCRPLAYAVGDPSQSEASVGQDMLAGVRGGGVTKADIPTDGTGGLDFQLLRCTGYFPDTRVPFVVPNSTTYNLTYGTNADGMASGPGINTDFYFYALPAHLAYPAGHNPTLAPREFQANSIAAGQFGSGIVSENQRGCLIVVSQETPQNFTTDTIGSPAAGAPSQLTHVGFGNVSVDRGTWVYLGAAHYRDDIFDGGVVADDSIAGQRTDGAQVYPQFRTGREVTTPGALDLRTTLTGGEFGALGNNIQFDASLPVTALTCEATVKVGVDDAGTGRTTFAFFDGLDPLRNWALAGNGSVTQVYIGQFSLQTQLTTSITTVEPDDYAVMVVISYTDSILSQRE